MLKQIINAIEATTAKTINCDEVPCFGLVGAVRVRRGLAGVRVFFRVLLISTE